MVFVLVTSTMLGAGKLDFLAFIFSDKRVTVISSKLVDVATPSKEGAMSPRLTYSKDKLFLTWLEPAVTKKFGKEKPEWRVMFSEWQNKEWGPPRIITSSPNLFLNWADFPSMISSSSGVLYAHWLEKNADNMPYAYDVQLAKSEDGGKHWSRLGHIRKNQPLHQNSYDGFVSFLPENNGVRAFWIDGRLHESKDVMTLRTVLIDKEVGKEEILDKSICSCCGTSAVSLPKGSGIFYRDRTKEEVRDIYKVRRQNGQWQVPKAVNNDNWEISGCPVNGPKAINLGNETAVVWFTAVDERPLVKMAWSDNGGESFDEPLIIDTISPDGPKGRVDVVMIKPGLVLISWLGRNEEGNAVLYLRVVNKDGQMSESLQVANLKADRKTGFPQLEMKGDRVLVAWREKSKLKNNLRIVSLSASEIISTISLE